MLVVACHAQPALTTQNISITTTVGVPSTTPTEITPVTLVITPPSTSLPVNTFDCNQDWQSLPIIPVVTDSERAIYQQGIMAGNDPRAFSKIGDGEISTGWFLADFDLGAGHYDLGAYQNLQAVIDNFQGSYGRTGIAAGRRFNTERVFDHWRADHTLCNAGETPLACEIRNHKPALALLSLGTNQVYQPLDFEAGLRRILDALLAEHILPILSTKGDNLEGDYLINRKIVCVAQEYQLPLWNFWASIQPLPNHGLQPDLEHLTYYGANNFNDPATMESAWAVRNLTALQVLDHVWRAVTK